MLKTHTYRTIPTRLSPEQFTEFILPHLTRGKRGPKNKLSFFQLYNYILKLLYTGCQWKELPIEKSADGKPEIHYSNIFRVLQRWARDGCFDEAFEQSVRRLHEKGLLDTRIVHGDGTTTAAKKGVTILATAATSI